MAEQSRAARSPRNEDRVARPGLPGGVPAVHAQRLARRPARGDARRRGAELRQAAGRAVRGVPRRDAGHPDRRREGAGQRHRLPVPAGQRLRLPDRRPRPGQRARAAARAAPGTTPVLYTRDRNSKETDAFFRSRDGELWVGRRHTLGREVDRAGHRDRAVRRRSAARWPSCAPGRTRVLRGLDPHVDRAVLAYEPDRRSSPGPRAGPGDLRAQAGQGRVGDRPAAGGDRRDRPRLRGRGPGAAGRPRRSRSGCSRASSGCAPGTTATTSATARSSAPARTRRSCTGSATPA